MTKIEEKKEWAAWSSIISAKEENEKCIRWEKQQLEEGQTNKPAKTKSKDLSSEPDDCCKYADGYSEWWWIPGEVRKSGMLQQSKGNMVYTFSS